MTIDARLTILLTLKGRHLFTLRWLWHANRVGLPFPVFIADGEVNSTIARLIEDPAVFPNLLIEYHRYNDRTFYDFYRKLEDALSKIKTPYVMMSDNDDFLFPCGIIKSVDYLEGSPDYVSAGGGIGHFETRVEKNQLLNLNGKVERLWYQQSRAYQSYDLDCPLAAERVCEAYSGFLTVCYNVFRVEALRKIANETAQFNFQRLDNAELFLMLRAATLGKIKSDASYISYFRQLGTSSNPSRGKDFVYSLSAEPYLEEIQRIVKRIAVIATQADGAEADGVAERLNAISAARLREKLIAVLGWRATVKGVLKKYMPQVLLTYVKTLGERVRSGKSSATGGRPISREGIFQLAARAGASGTLLANLQRELADVEYTMENGDFPAFVLGCAPELLRQDNRAPSGANV
jgi:glycosyltransferase domain-containing protein